MLPVFGFLLYIVALFIASKVYELRSGLYEVPLAIIGPSYPLLDTSMHSPPGPESANFTTGEWLLLLGSAAYFIMLISVGIIFIWVSVAHPWFLDEVYDKCFISTVDINDASWLQQEAHDPEEDHLIALKEKDATILLKVKEISILESELRALQASSTRQLEEARLAAAKKHSSIEADNVALRMTLDKLKPSPQAISIEHDKKLTAKEEDLLKLVTSSTRLIEEAKSTAAKKHSSITADITALCETLNELKLIYQAASIEHDKKLASKKEALLELGFNSARLLEETKSAAANKQSSMEADNAALRVALDEIKLSYQAASIEHDKKLALKEEDLLELRARSIRLLEEAELAAAKKHTSIEAENVALRMTLDELKSSHKTASIEHDKKLASKEADLLKLSADSTRRLKEAELAAAKRQSSIEEDNVALRVTLDKLKLIHEAASIEHEKTLALIEEDLLELRTRSIRLLEEAELAAAKKHTSIEAENVALRMTLDELKSSHQTASTEHDKKLASKEADLLKLGADSTRRLAEAESAAAKRQSSIEEDNVALRVILDELKLSHQAVSIEHEKKLASKERDLLELHASSTRLLEEAKSAAAKKESSIEADNAALRVALDEIKLSYRAASIEHDKKLASKEEVLLKFEQRMDEGLASFAEREERVAKLHSQEMANVIENYTKESKATARRNERAIHGLKEVIEELKRRGTTIKFGEVEDAVGTDLQLQLQHHSDYVTRLERWLPNSLASRKEKLAGLQSKKVEHEELETLYYIENSAYAEESLFAEAGSPKIRLPPKPQAKNDSSWSAEEAETRYCTEYLFAGTESPKVRLPKAQDVPKPVPPPAKDDLALMDPVRIPLPEDEDLNLLAPEWIPLPEGGDSELLEPEWIPLPEERDLEFLMPDEIPLPSGEDLDLLPELPDSEDLDLAPRGPKTKPPTSANKGGRAIPPLGAPKAPKAILALNARGGPKHGSSSRGSSWSRGGWGSYR